MITHAINEAAELPLFQTRGAKWRGEIGSDDHKTMIFTRSKANHAYQLYDDVLYKGMPCFIQDMHDDIRLVEWDGLKPKFIEVWSHETNEFYMVHPSDLRRVK
jgi:hypothetical protein